MPAFSFNDFTGGTSTDKYVGQKGSFYDSANVNVHESPEEIALSRVPTQFGATSGGGSDDSSRDVVAMFQIGSDVFQITTDGRAFKNYSGGPLGFGPTYGGNNYVFEDATIFGDYIYVAARRVGASRFAIFRDTVANWVAGTYNFTVDWAYHDYGSASLANADYGTRLITYKGSQLIVARNNKVWSIAKSSAAGAGGALDTIAPIKITLPYGQNVTCVTQNSEYVRVYTFDGWLYLWAGANMQPDFSQKLGLSVVRGVSDFKTDYVMTREKSVFEVVGFDYKRIIRGKSQLNDPMALYVSDGRFGNSMAMTNEFIFVPELNGVVVYGRQVDFLAKSANRRWVISGNENTLISCMFVTRDNSDSLSVLVAWENSGNSVHRIEDFSPTEYLSGNDYQTSGYVETLSYYGDSFYKRKKLKRIMLAYELESTGGGSVSVQVSFDGGAYSTAVTTSDATKRHLEILSPQIGSLEFHEMKAKITLTRDNALKTPKVKEVIFEYDDVQRG